MRQIALPSDLARIDQLTEALTAEAAGHLDPERLDCLQIALAEALVNIAKHGYGDRSGMIDVSFDVGAVVTVVLRDTGNPIPQSALDGPAAGTTGPDHRETGRGLALIRACCDAVDYRSTGEGNTLTLVFHPRASQRARASRAEKQV